MKIGRFQRIATIDNSFRCDACPIVVKKGVIIHDHFRSLRLLSLIVTNRGNVTVDEIEVKVISYDRYGNPVREENGQIGQICRFTDSGCLPDQSIGEGEVILLPSDAVVNCDVLVTRVKTAGNVGLVFTDADYEMDAPDKIAAAYDGGKRNRRLLIGLLIAFLCVIGIYMSLYFGVFRFVTETLPMREEQKFQDYLAGQQYSAALKQLERMGDTERRENVVLEALEFYMRAGNYEQAIAYAAKSNDPNKRFETLSRIVTFMEEDGGFEQALAFATQHKNRALKTQIYRDAIAHYTAAADFRSALTWVAKSGDASLGDGVYRAAVAYYAEELAYVTALDYAIKTEDTEVILTVYEDAIQMLVDQGDYNNAALYIARCNLPDDVNLNAERKREIIDAAQDSFIRLHAITFWQVLSFEQKQNLCAVTAAIHRDIIAVSKEGGILTTDSNMVWETTDAVSVAINAYHAVVLRSDGTVFAQGDNEYNQCDTQRWTNVISVACGAYHTVALMEDGSVTATGNNEYGQCNVGDWKDIVQIVCGGFFTVGLKRDGTVVATGRNNAGQCNVSEWREIVSLAAGENHTLGLRYNGTVAAAGVTLAPKCDVDEWANVKRIAAGSNHSLALLQDGTVLIAGGSYIDVSKIEWADILLIAAGDDNVLGVKEDKLYCLGSGKVSIKNFGEIRILPD